MLKNIPTLKKKNFNNDNNHEFEQEKNLHFDKI